MVKEGVGEREVGEARVEVVREMGRGGRKEKEEGRRRVRRRGGRSIMLADCSEVEQMFKNECFQICVRVDVKQFFSDFLAF